MRNDTILRCQVLLSTLRLLRCTTVTVLHIAEVCAPSWNTCYRKAHFWYCILYTVTVVYEYVCLIRSNERLPPPRDRASSTHFLCIYFYLNLTYRRCTSSLPSSLWSLRIFPSLPCSRLTIFYRDASSALLQFVDQWLNFTYSRSHAFRYGRKNTNPTLVRIGREIRW